MALWSNTDTAASKPKYLTAAEKNLTLGVSVDEAQTSANQAVGINTPGWVRTVAYTDAQGNPRRKSEVLVAMGTITGDNDTIDPDPVITIGTQPLAASVTAPATATFTVVATATRGATLSYVWQKSDDSGSTWTAITGATSASYTTPATTVLDDNGDQYRVIVSATGAVSVTSDAVTLTVA